MSETRRVRFKEFIWIHRWKLLTAWIIIFTVIVALGVRSNRHLVHENARRVHDIQLNQIRIQHSRTNSCKQTYEGIRLVFRPFFPRGKHATPDQLANIVKFNKTIDHLKRQCIKQTRTRRLVKP